MFRFPFYLIPRRELDLLMAGFGQMTQMTNNNFTAYVTALLMLEGERRDTGAEPRDIQVQLPIGDSMETEVLAAARLIARSLQNIPNTDSATAQFLAAILFEIQNAARRVGSAAMN